MNGTCALDALPLSHFTHAMGSGVMIDEKGTWVAMSSGSRTYQGWAAWVKRGLTIAHRRSDSGRRNLFQPVALLLLKPDVVRVK